MLHNHNKYQQFLKIMKEKRINIFEVKDVWKFPKAMYFLDIYGQKGMRESHILFGYRVLIYFNCW